MSGWPRCASVAPSHRLTSAWTIDCGCTTTSIAVVRRAEQVVRLDHLEALVHQRRGVDRDLAAHRPRRVLERLLDGDVLQLGARAAAERAAGGGQRRAGRPCPARSPAISWCSAECSESTGMSCAPVASAQRHHQLAADDERLLVGERDVDALGQRDDRRARARREPTIALSTRSAPVSATSRTSPSGPASTSPSVHASAARAAASASLSAIRSHAVRARLRDQRLVRAARPTARRARTRRARARRRRAPACRSSRWSRGSGAASSGDPVWHGGPTARLSGRARLVARRPQQRAHEPEADDAPRAIDAGVDPDARAVEEDVGDQQHRAGERDGEEREAGDQQLVRGLDDPRRARPGGSAAGARRTARSGRPPRARSPAAST